jgi:hypothetical protein
LERPFKDNKVFEVVKALHYYKALDPYGFTIGFFQACSDIMNVFHYFHARHMFEKNLNATFISLIPKTPGAVDIKDFQPISLVGRVHKIVPNF